MSQDFKVGPPMVSGPPREDLPFRYGCSCGAVWNTSRELNLEGCGRQLCGPSCIPNLFKLDEWLSAYDQPMSTFEEKVAEMERHQRAASEKMVKLAESVYRCPSRDDGGDHLPRFSGDDLTVRCTYCNEPLVVV